MIAWLEPIAERLEDAASARGRLAASPQHYVYVLCRADGAPFYVGKGVQDRCFHHEAQARNTDRLTHKLNLFRAMHRRGEAVRYCIESSFETEQEAHARERHLIALFGRHDQSRGPLTNQTDGGEGASNPSEESRERRRQSLWGDAEDEGRLVANKWFRKPLPGGGARSDPGGTGGRCGTGFPSSKGTLSLNVAGFRYIVSELGRSMLEGAGVLLPEVGAAVR